MMLHRRKVQLVHLVLEKDLTRKCTIEWKDWFHEVQQQSLLATLLKVRQTLHSISGASLGFHN